MIKVFFFFIYILIDLVFVYFKIYAEFLGTKKLNLYIFQNFKNQIC